MRKVIALFLAVTLGLVAWQCDDSVNAPVEEQNEVRPLTASEKDVAGSSDRFGIKLFKEIVASEDADNNVFISPLSVSVAFGMAYNGARGETRDQMADVLELNGLTPEQINEAYQSLIALLTQIDPAVIFEVANSLWPQQGFPIKDDFLQVNRDYFDAEARALDFARKAPEAVEIINGWCCDKTHELICQPLNELDPATILVLVNAIYFKGDWTRSFADTATTEEPFHLANGSTAPCMMMTQTDTLDYFETEQFQAVDLPYGNGDFSMTVFLPQEGHSVDDLIASLDVDTYQQWLGGFVPEETRLWLPRFTVKCKYELRDILSTMGMELAFQGGRADFSGITDAQKIFISRVIHQTYCAVDEVGTEAAAVTIIIFETTNNGPSGAAMRVDRPFMFVIRENSSGTILFAGKIMNPGMP